MELLLAVLLVVVGVAGWAAADVMRAERRTARQLELEAKARSAERGIIPSIFDVDGVPAASRPRPTRTGGGFNIFHDFFGLDDPFLPGDVPAARAAKGGRGGGENGN